MSFRSDAHLLLGGEPTPPEVTAWQHPNYPDSFTVTLDTADRRGHIAISGSPSQLIELLARMTPGDHRYRYRCRPAPRRPAADPAGRGGHHQLASSPRPRSGPGSRRHSEHPARTPGSEVP